MRKFLVVLLSVFAFSQSAFSAVNPDEFVKINSIEIVGNKSMTEDQILSPLNALGNVSISKVKFKRGDIEKIIEIVKISYRKEGHYVSAKVKSFKNGNLQIAVNESSYKAVEFSGVDKAFEREALKYLDKSKNLERAALLLSDISGENLSFGVTEGKNGDNKLKISSSESKRFGGSVGLNNYGNRYIGSLQSNVSAYARNVVKYGDKIDATFFRTFGDLWYGSLNYSNPIGYSGLRTEYGYSRVNYELGKEYQSYDFNGTTDIVKAGVSYPLIRSLKRNLSISVNYNRKWFVDKSNLSSGTDRKHSDILPVKLGFSNQDEIFGKGLTYGYVSWTHGVLSLDSGLKSTDDTTKKSDGGFDKVNFDVARIQSSPVDNLTLFVRGFGQAAFKNLDISERFSVGGSDAVRAYPLGESFSDEAIVTQFELRYKVNNFVPYAFYDFGTSKTNHSSWSSYTTRNSRTIAGAGFGLKFNYKGFNLGSTIAWRTVGSYSNSDSKAKTPTIWFNSQYSF